MDKEIIGIDAALKKAQQRITFVAQDEETLRAYERREMALSDFVSGMNNARRKGIAIGEKRGEKRGIAISERKGIAIGEQRGKQQREIRFVLKLSQEGKSVAEIAELVELSVKDVKQILKTS
ncbi:MAG: hypothetical protein LBL94_05735 [Prevotellaceae bacterium]|jgi:DNA-binding NarL/FixJ family response regulator|nr:hypothetical protein [Prevotellaceae bacterium]